jgi:Ser/Thr protein kinase RdoA (MazF antagonist)
VGVPVAMPLQSLRELFIEEVDWGEHLYYAVVFEGLHGRQWSDPNDLTLTLFKEWGSTLAKIHQASQTFASGSSPRRPSWKDTLREAREWLPAEDKIAHYELSVTSEWLMSMPIDAENYGLIHRDPELDNLIWDGRHFQVFDFDDCVYCWYVADIAAGLDELWHNDKLAQTPWLSSFLEGYCAVLNTVEVREFDLRQFLRCIRIFDYAQVVNALQTTTDPAPPWLVAIKKRSENWLTAQRKLIATNAACAHNR